ncbi:MAG TPA: MFS transporter [Anaeromyxobacteraceae bacterium]|nr:MFS transporter [Anaeromyxobacteraceae bacterium]
MPRVTQGRFPPQIKYLAWNEGCERFSYYGMTSVLTIYMAQRLFLSDGEAESRYHLFVFAVYVTPLLGAWLADRFFGRFRVVLWLSLGYVLGHAVIAGFESREGLYTGLALIALGAGGIKPCAAAFVGDQFTDEKRHLLKRVYDLYYWMINLGSTASTLLIPVLLDRMGPRVAFAIPGLLMAGAIAIFWAGRRSYVVRPPTGPNPHGFFRVVSHAVAKLGTGRPGQSWLDVARDRFPDEAVDGAKAVFRIIAVFAPTAAFWALFFQYGSSWVLQAERMDRRVFGLEVLSSQVPTLDPVLVLVLIPVFAGLVYPWLERRGSRVHALGKMTVGMYITVLSFLCAGAVQVALDLGVRPGIAWQVPQYVFLAMGEVLVSVTALEFAYTQAPASMKSAIMSLWYVTIAAGSLLTAWVAGLNRFHGAGYYFFFAALMLAAAFAFQAVAGRYRPVQREPATFPVAEAR